MRQTCHNRRFLTRWSYVTIASFLTWSTPIAMPLSAMAAELPLGLATGAREAQVSLDGKSWSALQNSSSTVNEGTMIRTGKGTASVTLKEGTQLELQPRTLIELSGTRTAPVAKIATGRVLFRMPAASHAAFATPTVRYQTAAGMQADPATLVKVKTSMPSDADAMGEITVSPQAGSRLSLQQGEIRANSVGNPGLHIVKAGQSVHMPQTSAVDPSFSVLLAQALAPGEPVAIGVPPNTQAIYDVNGRSLGYLKADGSFVRSPGIVANLPNPIPEGTIPPDANIPPGATAIFVVQSPAVYVGYILDDKYAAYIPPGGGGGASAAAGGGTAGGSAAGGATVGMLTTLTVIGAGVGLGVGLSGDGDGNGKASPSTP